VVGSRNVVPTPAPPYDHGLKFFEEQRFAQWPPEILSPVACFRAFNGSVVFPTGCTTIEIVPFFATEFAMVRGIRFLVLAIAESRTARSWRFNHESLAQRSEENLLRYLVSVN
jgi:hypothetical protein